MSGSTGEMTEDEREERLVELVRLDYDAALRTMNGFITTSAQLRAAGIAAWAVIFGFAVRDASAVLAVLSLFVVAVFWYADAYHAALYRSALRRVLDLEDLLDAYVDRLGIDAQQPEAIVRMTARLEAHRFGVHRNLKAVRFDDLLRGRPRVVFRGIYPVLAASSLATAGVSLLT